MNKTRKNKPVSRHSLSKSAPKIKSSRHKRWNVRRIFIVALTLSALFGISLTGVAALKKDWEKIRDLSVIGNGIPTIVQVYDSKCKLCRALKSNTETTLRKNFKDRFQYKIADIKTGKGRRFQLEHDVPHVTLLLFDSDGQLRMNLNGVKEVPDLNRQFDDFLKTWAK